MFIQILLIVNIKGLSGSKCWMIKTEQNKPYLSCFGTIPGVGGVVHKPSDHVFGCSLGGLHCGLLDFECNGYMNK